MVNIQVWIRIIILNKKGRKTTTTFEINFISECWTSVGKRKKIKYKKNIEIKEII